MSRFGGTSRAGMPSGVSSLMPPWWTLLYLLLMVAPVTAWSESQQLALALAPKFSGTLSLMGSIFIITDIVKSKAKMGRTYSRILLVMSLYDGFTSIAQGLSTWPMPEDTAGVKFAKGTTFTCNFQGFFTQLGIGAPMYNCSLSFYYVLVIAFAMNEARVRYFEWFMHLVPLTFSFGTAIAGLPLTLYNPSGLWCWIAALPGDCIDGNNPEGQDECQRGHYAWIYRWAIYYGPLWLSIVVITFNMTVVSYLVWAKERASLRFRFGYNNPSNLTASVTGEHDPDPSHGESDVGNGRGKFKASATTRRQRKNRKHKGKKGLASQVFWQAFYYVLAFYITWIAPTILRMRQTLGKTVPFGIVMAMACLLPLQGFCNMLIYVRPRVVQYRNRNPERGMFHAISRACRRTMSVMYVSESRAFHETDVQDVDVLDPCFALQEEIEQDAKRRADEKVASIHEQQNTDGSVEKTARENMDKRLLDEIKLLEEEDPSFFHELQSENFNLGTEYDDDDVVDGDHPTSGRIMAASSLGDGEFQEDSSGVVSVRLGRQPDGSTKNDSVEMSDASNPSQKTLSDSKDGAEDEADNSAEAKTYRYPEFSCDPDFFFI